MLHSLLPNMPGLPAAVHMLASCIDGVLVGAIVYELRMSNAIFLDIKKMLRGNSTSRQ